MYKLLFFLTVVFLSCNATNTTTTTYYIVRHAEKAPGSMMSDSTMTTDVPLSEGGEKRAVALKEKLGDEKISHIFSTNFLRTRSTVQPLADALNIPIETYSVDDRDFVSKLKTMDGKIVIVGHSNTVDDLVNGLTGKKEISGDLPESEYGDLFVVKKKGDDFSFDKQHFGE